jgi:hemolysin activation/secretion protein
VEGGVIRLQAIEGYVANVRIEGENAAFQERVGRYAEKIKATRPLTAAALERYLLLINDLPGVFARAVLAPAKTASGASDLVLQVSQRAFAGGLSVDNRGSRAQGPRRFSGDVDVHSLFGGQSRTGLKFVTTGDAELRYLSLSHDQLIGTEGGKFGIAASQVQSTPEEMAIIPLNLVTDSKTLTLTYSYPVVRSRAQNLYLRGTASAFNGKTEIFGVRDTEDRVRPLRLGLTYDRADALGGVNIVDVEFSHGLRAFGASSNGDPFLSRPNGRVDFSKLTLYAARLQSLPANWSVLAAVNGQRAFTDLLASELFSFGGEQFGRGYDPSELLSDHGAALKLELRYSGTLPGEMPTTYTPYGFYDVGEVWQRTPVPGVDASQSAASAGLGVRLSVGRHLSGVVELAKPLTKIVAQENNTKLRTYAGISIRF